ncbi:hypothetical protein FB451DRAFT_1551087 [Mycena latifolia]|nr:hypothetical protein FB451DRAFT_1551087 [Mycena latifolia]
MPSLPDLPTELLVQIIKHYPELYLDIDASIHGVPSDRFSGNDTLRELSQTCRILRGIFLPILWERVHACFTKRNSPKRKTPQRPKMLERRMIGIQKTAYVLPYIHSLSVTLQECSMSNWQPMAQFIRVLQLLPNLRNLTIIRPPFDMVSIFVASMEGKVIPSVVSLVLPDARLAPILHCFPNVQILTCQNSYHCGGLLEGTKDSCKQIHTINNFYLSSSVVQLLREAIPQVKCLSIWNNIQDWQKGSLPLLEGMDNLSDLRIHYRPPPTGFYAQRVLPLDEIIAAAKRILGTSNAKGRKELHIQHLQGNVAEFVRIFTKEEIFMVAGASDY